MYGRLYVGGVVGDNQGTVTNSYTACNQRLIGLAGGNASVHNSYYDVTLAGLMELPGRGAARTTAQMTHPVDFPTTYLGWDFTILWHATQALNDGYPQFKLAMSASFHGTSPCTGFLDLYGLLSGVVLAQSSAEAQLSMLHLLDGFIQGYTDLDGSIHIIQSLYGTMDARTLLFIQWLLRMWAKRNGAYEPVKGFVKSGGVYNKPILSVSRKVDGESKE